MTWETGLLWGALAAFVASIGAQLPRWTLDVARRERVTTLALRLGVMLTVGSLALLTLYFLAGRIENEYVFTYSRTTYPWYYRLAGLWAGQKGTLLIWTAALGVFGLAMLHKGERAIRAARVPEAARMTLRHARIALAALLALLLGATLVADTFAATPEYLLKFRPSGNGLQPVLLTPFMIIHPPIQFLSYALTGVLFALALAHVANGERHWATLVRPWARLNWLLATIGLGLGGLWAYYVLNFGGFWAWDPVETANLLAWFPLTLLLHALLRYDEGRFRTAAPIFALLALVMAFFSTVATRTGLWVSVHAFTDPSKNFARDPLVRLLNILETSELLRYLVAVLLVLPLLALVALWLGRTRNWAEPRRTRARALGAAALTTVGAFVMLDVVGALSLSFEAADAVTFGRSAPLGLALFAFVGLAAIILTGHEETAPAPGTGRSWSERWLTSRTLLALGVGALTLAFLVVLILELASVNGFRRELYDERAPLIGTLVLLILSTLFLLPALGAKRAAGTAAAAAAVGAALALAWRDHWHVLLVLPLLIVAAFATLTRVLALTSGAPRATRERLAALLLILGSLVGFVYWGNPPTHLDLYVAQLQPHWSWAIPAYALCGFALAAGALHRARPAPPAARWGAVGLILCMGPFLALTIVGIVVLALVREAAPAGTWRDIVAERRAALRKASIYVLHFGLVLGLTGYALATYESEESGELRVQGGGSDAFNRYTFQLVASRGVGWDPIQRLPREVQADVRVLQDGVELETATLVYWLVPDDTPGHYDARVTVLRRATEDLYVFPVMLKTQHGELTDHVNGARPTDPVVTEAVVTLKVLPGAGLVWTGLWMLGLAMTANLALGGFAIVEPAGLRRPVSHPEALPQTELLAPTSMDPPP